MKLGMMPSPGINPVCVFFKYLGTKRVVAKSELLVGEAVAADVEPKKVGFLVRSVLFFSSMST
jgi:hypothetical protein